MINLFENVYIFKEVSIKGEPILRSIAQYLKLTVWFRSPKQNKGLFLL